ncbi:MAG: hypothetical protein R6U84_06995 [Candidatus Cloacimonadales bacterium]
MPDLTNPAVSDSLELAATDADSLDVEAEEILPEVATGDSLQDFRRELKTKLDKIASEEDLIIPLDFYYREDFHLKSAYEEEHYFTLNNFTLLDTMRSNTLLLQTYLPFYKQQNSGKLINFANSGYDLVVPYTATYLGLGDEEMNHGYFSFKKGEIFGLKNLKLETSYLGYAGNWLGSNEKASNLDFHLAWDSAFGKWQYNFTNINQDISASRSDFISAEPEIEDLSTAHALSFQNAWLDLGYRQTKSSLDSLETEYSQIYISKKFASRQHNLQLTYEKFFDHYDLQNWRWQQQSNLAGFSWQNSGFWRDNQQYHYFSHLSYQLADFQVGAEFSEAESTIHFRDLLGNLAYKAKNFSLILKSGERQVAADKWQISRLKTQLTLPWRNCSLILATHWEYQPDAPLQIPENQLISELALALNLQYENHLQLGFLHTYSSEYQPAGLIASADNLDFYLKVEITRYFEMYGKVVNVLDNHSMYDQLETVPARHLNYGVKWLFVN